MAPEQTGGIVRHTTPAVAYDAVNSLAQQMGIHVAQSEFVGLVPESAVDGTDEEALKLQSQLRDRLLEAEGESRGRQVLAGVEDET